MIIEIDIAIFLKRKIKHNWYCNFLEQAWLDSDTISP